MKIMNEKEVEAQILANLEPQVQKALENAIQDIVGELPQGSSSSIAGELVAEKIGPGEFVIKASRVWTYLNDGTGIYSEKHRGAGPGGLIVPTSGAKVLHFKNKELATALGFPDENVFLASVKGITPRFYWDRYFNGQRLSEYIARA